MKVRNILLSAVLVLAANCTAFADRALSRTEILQIFQQLTNQPRHTWLPAGTIEATHSEYRAPKITDANQLLAAISQKIAAYQNSTAKPELTSDLQNMMLAAIPFNTRYELANEYTMNSETTVKFDGSRFYWEINVISRNDSVAPTAVLNSNYMTNQFNMAGNARRMFVWDGAKYTTYFLPSNQATVDTAGNLPHTVNGPLTAGVVPWGNGAYSLDNLTAADANAVEITSNGQTLVYLTLTNSDGTQTIFTLDPSMGYAVTSLTANRPDAITLQQYSNYQQVSGVWLPANISLEKYDASSGRLLASDQWQITAVDGNTPSADAFAINFKPAAMIEYTKPTATRLAVCRNTVPPAVSLPALSFVEVSNPPTGNCATVALKYAASHLGKNISDKQLTSLVSGTQRSTNLLAMKNFANNLGLYANAVPADINTLRNLKNCQVILHIPGKNHFVILNGFDGQKAMVSDPINNRLFAITQDLSKCTALLISNQPVNGNLAVLPDARLQTIFGAGYSCSNLLQQENWVYCNEPADGDCDGLYAYYYPRYGCAVAASGTCSMTSMIRYQTTPCIYDPSVEGCNVTGTWTSYYMKACM